MSDATRPHATAAAHYLRGRAPYSRLLPAVIRAELGLEGAGVLLDVGTGPGSLAVQLAGLFDEVIGLDPEPAMLDQARLHAAAHSVQATWIEAQAEDLATLELPTPRLVTFGQSLHWTDEQAVLAIVHNLLNPGGTVALIAHDPTHGTAPTDAPGVAIPHQAIEELINRYVGWSRTPREDTYATSLRGSPFGESRLVYAPGRADIVRGADEVVANYLSMSFAAPDRFGDRTGEFVADLKALLDAVAPHGQFHDWPGDTAIIWATKQE